MITNADKYLKDEKYIFDIAKGIAEAICYDDMEHLKKITEKEIKDWFTSSTKPTLTEDERVILRNIQLYTGKSVTIRRIGDGHLYISGGCGFIDFGEYNHLFQFIKERRRILY